MTAAAAAGGDEQTAVCSLNLRSLFVLDKIYQAEYTEKKGLAD